MLALIIKYFILICPIYLNAQTTLSKYEKNVAKPNILSAVLKEIFTNVVKNKTDFFQEFNSECKRDLILYIEVLSNFNVSANAWALKMFDSSFKIPNAGAWPNFLLEGTGDFDQCLDVKHPNNNFVGQYCSFVLSQNNHDRTYLKKDSVNLGFCLPSTCEEKQIVALMNLRQLKNDLSIFIDPGMCRVRRIPHLNSRAKFGLYFLVFFLGIVLLSTLYHYFSLSRKDITLPKYIGIFSIFKSYEEVSELKGNQYAMLNGCRVVLTIVVVLNHMKWAMIGGPFLNGEYIKKTEFSFDPNLMTGFSVVDIFFSISWFVITMSVAKLKEGGFMPIYRKITMKFIRMLPMTFLLICVVSPLFPYFVEGPFAHRHLPQITEACAGNEWTFLTFLNTIMCDMNSIRCQPPLWYLSTDMQLTMLLPLLVAFIYKYPRASKMWIFLAIVWCCGYKWHNAVKHNYSPGLDSLDSAQYLHYIRSYNRIPIWTTSVLAGLQVYRELHVGKKSSITKREVILGWTVWTLTCLFLTVFTLLHSVFGYQFNSIHSASFIVIRKLLMPVVTLWPIYAMAHGHGGIIEKVFSWRVLLRLERFNFGVFILHYTYHSWKYSQNLAPYLYSHSWKFRHSVPDVIILYALSFIVTIVFDGPLSRLLTSIFNKIWPTTKIKQ